MADVGKAAMPAGASPFEDRRKAYNRSRSKRLPQRTTGRTGAGYSFGPRQCLKLGPNASLGVDMKFHLSPTTANVVTGFGVDWVRIGAQEYRDNLIVTPESVVSTWAAEGFDALTEHDFNALLASNPEVVILGTGRSIRFPNPVLSRPVMQARVGLEVMDTGAACRTYNILAAEGRRVAAGLLIRE
jgi:uncharacterized protein